MLHFIHEICKAKPYNGESVRYLHQKLDGHRLTVLTQPRNCEKQIAFLTRNSTDLFPDMYIKAKQFNIWPWIYDLCRLPPKTSVDGELWVSGQPASYIKTAIKNNDPRLRFTAFAVPWLEGVRKYTENLPWAMDFATINKIEFSPFVDLLSTEPVDVEKTIKLAPKHTEGWVAKVYQYSHWYKIKRVNTIDLIVTGVTEGKGKYSGLIGSLRCSIWDGKGQLREVCVCSGMTDEQRKDMSLHDPIGRVCEVSYQEVASLGRLRHPNFIKWREDKQPNECTMGQEVSLLNYWNTRGD